MALKNDLDSACQEGHKSQLLLVSTDLSLRREIESLLAGVACVISPLTNLGDVLPCVETGEPVVVVIDSSTSENDFLDNLLPAIAANLNAMTVVLVPKAESNGPRWVGLGSGRIDIMTTPINVLSVRARLRQHLNTVVLEDNLRQSNLHMAVADRLLDSMIANRKKYESELKLFKTALDSALDAVLMLDSNTFRFIYSNKGAVENFGYSHPELQEMSIFDLVSGHEREELVALLDTLLVTPSIHIDSYCEHRSGRRLPVYLFLQFIADLNEEGLFLVFLSDRSDHVAQTTALEYQGAHDSLTGLPNRALFLDRGKQAISACQRTEGNVGMILIDLDRFKEVNDTLGHPVGDKLLQRIGAALRSAVRETDTVARLGGDEFAVLVLNVHSIDDVLEVAKKITEATNCDFDVSGHRLHVGLSMGLVLYPQHGNEIATLLRRADVAMYVSKRNLMQYAIYDSKFDRDRELLFQLEKELREAIKLDQLELYYQPKIDVSSGVVAGIEALVRWPHARKGMIMPGAFISLAERTGLVHPMTEWIINRALRDYSAWDAESVLGSLSINLSAQNLHDTELPEFVSRMLTKWHVDPRYIEFELTESDIMRDTDTALSVMQKLNEMGIRFAVDDYGTGYSSLAYLKKLPVDTLKIDRSFISNMIDDGDDLVIVHSTIELAHNLGLSVVAEGVESEEAWALLQSLGCDTIQGYIASKPIPIERLEPWIDSFDGLDDFNTLVPPT